MKKILSILLLGLLISGCSAPVPDENLGFSVASGYQTTLSSSMTSTQATVPVSAITTKIGDTLSMAVLGDKVFFTLEPGGSKEEIVMCTGLSSTTWTGCTRGLSSTGTSTVAVSANKKAHNSGAIVVMSNVHYVYEELTDKDSNETIGGVKTYTLYPEIAGSDNATTSRQLITLDQLNAVSIQGGATSTENQIGFSTLSTQIQMASSTDLGIENPLVLQAKYATSTCQVSGHYNPITKVNGKLGNTCLDLAESWIYTGDLSVASTTFMASTTWDILPEYTSDPAGNNEAVRKSYTDDRFAQLDIFSHVDIVSATFDAADAEATTTTKCLATTMGANDAIKFRMTEKIDVSSGNGIHALYLGNGTATSSIVTITSTDSSAFIWDLYIANRNSVSSQYITGIAQNATTQVYVAGTSAVDISSQFCFELTGDSSAQDGRTQTIHLLDAQIIRP